MKARSALANYRALPPENPSADTDAMILAAARAAQARLPGRRVMQVTGGLALLCLVVLLVRWVLPEAPSVDTRTFGLAEGQVRTYLTTFDISATQHPWPEETIP